MGRCLPFHLATAPLGGARRLSPCASHDVEAPASYPANARSVRAEPRRSARCSRARTLWFRVLRGARTPREDGRILLGVCRRTMHISTLDWVALLAETCCSAIIRCRLHGEGQWESKCSVTFACKKKKNAACAEHQSAFLSPGDMP